MSFLLNCPNCGPRDVAEYRYGGEIARATEATNLPGVQRERWYHRFGCRRWLVVERDVRTNEVQGLPSPLTPDPSPPKGEGS